MKLKVKKAVIAAVCLAMMTSLAACGSKENKERRCGNPGRIERFHRRHDCIRGIFPGTGRCGV